MIKKIMTATLLAAVIIPSISVRADFIESHETHKPFIIGLTQEEPIGVLYPNKEVIIFSGPNVFGNELGRIEKDKEVSIFQIMVNGWVRVEIGGNHGYIDNSLLREELDHKNPLIIRQKLPETVEKKPEIIPTPEKRVEKKAESVTTFKLSFYTDFLKENGGYTTTASGKVPKYGMVASNVYPIGTKIHLEGYGEMIVEDRGGKHFNSADRLDIFIPRKEGESREEYRRRVLNLGRKETQGYIIG